MEPIVVTDRYYPGPNGRLRISQRKIDKTKSNELNPVLLQTAREETKKNNIMEVEVPFWPFGMRWEKNELLEVNIATNDQIIRPEFPDLPSNPNVSEGQCIIHFGGIYDSQIRLPLVKG